MEGNLAEALLFTYAHRPQQAYRLTHKQVWKATPLRLCSSHTGMEGILSGSTPHMQCLCSGQRTAVSGVLTLGDDTRRQHNLTPVEPVDYPGGLLTLGYHDERTCCAGSRIIRTCIHLRTPRQVGHAR